MGSIALFTVVVGEFQNQEILKELKSHIPKIIKTSKHILYMPYSRGGQTVNRDRPVDRKKNWHCKIIIFLTSFELNKKSFPWFSDVIFTFLESWVLKTENKLSKSVFPPPCKDYSRSRGDF